VPKARGVVAIQIFADSDGDRVVGFVLKIWSFVIWSFKNLDCYGTLGNFVITGLWPLLR
jgi:hypothetical protein